MKRQTSSRTTSRKYDSSGNAATAWRERDASLEENDLPFPEFEEWLYEGVMEAERPVNAERHRVMAECDSFYLGGEYQFTIPSKIDGFPLLEQRDPNEIFFCDDQLGPLVDNNCTQFVRSRGLLKWIAPQDIDDAEGIARVASAIWGHYQERLLRQDYLQREARRLMTQGGAWRAVYFDPHAGPRRQVPRMAEVEEKLAEDAWYCPECGAQGSADEVAEANRPGDANQMETCPDCGHDDIVRVTVPPAILDKEVGSHTEPAGDLAIDQPDGYEMTTNSWAGTWDETIFLNRKRRLDEGLLHSMFPFAKFEEFDPYENDGNGLVYQRRFEAMFDPFADTDTRLARSAVRFGRERDYTETWYAPTYYEGKTLPEDFVLYEGTEEEVQLEAGVALEEYFPSGMRVCKTGRQILGVFNEDFHDKFIYYRYKIVPGRFYGKGIEGAVPLQRWLNELVSLVMTFLMTSASPVFLFDENAFPDGMPPAGTPAQRIPVGAKPMDLSMDQIIKIVPPGTLSMGVFEMFAKVKEEMQAHLGAFSFFAGALPEAAQATATGLSLVHDQASGLMMMPLALRAEADARFGEMVLKLFRRHCRDKRYFQVAGPYSQQELEGLFAGGDDLPEEIVATVEPNSYYPRLAYQLRNDAVEFFNWRGDYTMKHGHPPSPSEEQMMAERFGLPEILNTALVAGRRERQNFQVMRDFLLRFQSGELQPEEQLQVMESVRQATIKAVTDAQQAQMMAAQQGMPAPPPELPNPEDVVIDVAMQLAPIWDEQDDHAAMVEWLKRYANKDEGSKEPPIVRQLIERRIKARREAAARVEAEKQSTLSKAMEPEMNRQFAMQLEQQAAAAQVTGASAPATENPTVPEGPMPSTQAEQKRERRGQRANLPTQSPAGAAPPPPMG